MHQLENEQQIYENSSSRVGFGNNQARQNSIPWAKTNGSRETSPSGLLGSKQVSPSPKDHKYFQKKIGTNSTLKH